MRSTIKLSLFLGIIVMICGSISSAAAMTSQQYNSYLSLLNSKITIKNNWETPMDSNAKFILGEEGLVNGRYFTSGNYTLTFSDSFDGNTVCYDGFSAGFNVKDVIFDPQIDDKSFKVLYSVPNSVYNNIEEGKTYIIEIMPFVGNRTTTLAYNILGMNWSYRSSIDNVNQITEFPYKQYHYRINLDFTVRIGVELIDLTVDEIIIPETTTTTTTSSDSSTTTTTGITQVYVIGLDLSLPTIFFLILGIGTLYYTTKHNRKVEI